MTLSTEQILERLQDGEEYSRLYFDYSFPKNRSKIRDMIKRRYIKKADGGALQIDTRGANYLKKRFYWRYFSKPLIRQQLEIFIYCHPKPRSAREIAKEFNLLQSAIAGFKKRHAKHLIEFIIPPKERLLDGKRNRYEIQTTQESFIHALQCVKLIKSEERERKNK